MAVKKIATAYEYVELTEEERIKKNLQTKKSREKIKQLDPEKFKEKDKIRNRLYYLRKKEKKAAELAAKNQEKSNEVSTTEEKSNL